MGIPGPRVYDGGGVTGRRIYHVRPAVIYGLLAILMAAVFVPMSLYRIVDGDEGTYLLVSRLVAEGQLPYHDFFYPQMFLLPYVYGAWMKLVGYSWYGARLLSAFFSIALGLLLYRQAAHLAGARAWGLLAAVLFTFTSRLRLVPHHQDVRPPDAPPLRSVRRPLDPVALEMAR